MSSRMSQVSISENAELVNDAFDLVYYYDPNLCEIHGRVRFAILYLIIEYVLCLIHVIESHDLIIDVYHMIISQTLPPLTKIISQLNSR